MSLSQLTPRACQAGLLVVALAGTGAWYWRSQISPPISSESPGKQPTLERGGEPDLEKPIAGVGFQPQENPPATGPRRPARLTQGHPATAAPRVVTDEEVWAAYNPTREELAYRAFRAEREAEHELRNLLPVLDLDEEQEDRVFAALVRRSDFYHPSLQPQRSDGTPISATPPPPEAAPAGGNGEVTTPGAPNGETMPDAPVPTDPVDPVVVELTPELADVYERYTSERHAFWVGIIEDIEQELNSR